MQPSLIYACTWLVLLTAVIIDRRVIWVHHHLSWLRVVLHRLHFFTPFVEREFPAHSVLQVPFFLLICCSNVVIFLYPRAILLESVAARIGEVMFINIIFLLLISSRHSLFLELAALYQPEVMWAHKMLGNVVIVEVFGYVILSVKR